MFKYCKESRISKRKNYIDNYFFSYRCKPLTVEAIERVLKITGQREKFRESIMCSSYTCKYYFAQTKLRNRLDIYSLSRILVYETVEVTKRYQKSIKELTNCRNKYWNKLINEFK